MEADIRKTLEGMIVSALFGLGAFGTLVPSLLGNIAKITATNVSIYTYSFLVVGYLIAPIIVYLLWILHKRRENEEGFSWLKQEKIFVSFSGYIFFAIALAILVVIEPNKGDEHYYPLAMFCIIAIIVPMIWGQHDVKILLLIYVVFLVAFFFLIGFNKNLNRYCFDKINARSEAISKLGKFSKKTILLAENNFLSLRMKGSEQELNAKEYRLAEAFSSKMKENFWALYGRGDSITKLTRSNYTYLDSTFLSISTKLRTSIQEMHNQEGGMFSIPDSLILLDSSKKSTDIISTINHKTKLYISKTIMVYLEDFSHLLDRIRYVKRHKQQQDWEVILKHTQTVGLIFLISVFISLGYFRWNLPKSKGATFSERNLTLSFMIIVGIQIVTLSKYIESEKLNVEDPFFAFTLPNWYAPSLISDISNIDQEIKIDESPPIYILPPEMDEVLKSIDNLSKKVGTLEENMENYI